VPHSAETGNGIKYSPPGSVIEVALYLNPYGLDISPIFIGLAKKRLPQFADHFFVYNSFYWIPPKKFDYVRTELVYVPGEYEKQ